MSFAKSRNKYLKHPAKFYFDLWIELGTIARVAEHLFNLGEKNPKTGKKITDSAIHRLIMLYVLENPDDAKPYFEQENGGIPIDQTDWEEYLVGKATNVYNTSAKRLIQWLNRNPWAKKYDYIYANRLPDGKLD